MVQFEILSGRTAGTKWTARRFPVRIGREQGMDLRLEDPGVWDKHLELALIPTQGFVLQAQPDAMVMLNGQPVNHALLKNGDQVEMGAVKLRFWLSEARQRGLTLREAFFWIIVAAVSLGQVALIYWLK
jgi:pSer/pThr/pTyr-binding forkhead associated (FHA) protein